MNQQNSKNNSKGHNHEKGLIESVYNVSVKSVLYEELCRIEKLTSALYMVTELFEINDPLKRHIRERSIDLLKTTHVPYDSDQNDIAIRINYLLSFIDAIVSFIEVAKIAGNISPMNASLLLKELKSLHLHLYGRLSRIIDKPSDDYIAKIFEQNTLISLEDHFDEENISEQAPPKKAAEITPGSAVSPKKKIQNDTPEVGKKSFLKESRQNDILNLIKDKGEVTIKDIASRIVKCSEKTLQRDLQEMMNKGHIVKEGSKRWSKYRLA